ncbi:putative reverse transcriptase domain-containing protein [Tanacetum coccineum]
MLGAEEARQDPNIVMSTFTLNNHFTTTLFDSGADYNFVSTTFIPLLGLEPNDLGYKYEIEIASGQLVVIDKVIKGCMDWLSNYKAEIICHEKVVRIPLPDGKVLRVVGERPKEKARLLMSAKASDKKQEEIVVVRDFPEGRGNQGNQARGRAFMLGAKEARQDPNIVTGTFTLNNHFATTLFDSGADYSFVSTTFIPLLGIEPSELGFRYEIEIASGQLVEIDKVIKGCKLEIEGHVFDIDLIPFEHGSFDVIIGMDWLSNHKAEIICHEKVVRIPLLDGKVLRVLGERPKEKARLLISAKARDKKKEEIVVVRDFPEVFPDDLSGLPPLREIESRIELILGALPIAKSPYRLAPSELEELSGQLKEL